MSTAAVRQESIDTSSKSTGATKAPVLEFRATHDLGLVERALTDRVEELKKVAEKTGKEGYHREARAITADAGAIEHLLLPQLRAQRPLPLVTDEEFRKEVETALRRRIFRAFDKLDEPKVAISADAIRGRRDQLISDVAQRVVIFAREVIQSAYDEGYQARGREAEVIALEHIDTLKVD